MEVVSDYQHLHQVSNPLHSSGFIFILFYYFICMGVSKGTLKTYSPNRTSLSVSCMDHTPGSHVYAEPEEK